MAAEVLIALLGELADVVRRIAPAIYVAEPVPGVSGSIGAHVRHVLDHVAAFAAADSSSVLSYDSRERGTAVEREASAALRHIVELQQALERLGHRPTDEPIEVSALVAAGQAPVKGWSTRGRELAFVVSHTIHHQAIIAMLMAAAGGSAPARFGYAPSTPVGRDLQPCAP